MRINNRELSWLAFNERVLQEAQDTSVPLMQRLRFLGIFSNNQDEFIKVRVAKLIQLNKSRHKVSSDGFSTEELLTLVNNKIDSARETFEKTYNEILSEMESNNIFVVNETQLSEYQIAFCRDYFSKEISQWLVPIIIRKASKMPFLSDSKIYLAVKMSSSSTKNARYAILQIPVNRTCPRFVQLPSHNNQTNIIFIDDILRLCLDEIFFMFNYDNISAHSFKFIRDGQFTVDDDISKSIIEKMELGLNERQNGEPVRLTYDKDMPQDLLETIISKLKLDKNELLASGRYRMMKDLMKFPIVRPNLEDTILPPLQHPDIKKFSSIIDIVSKKDIFLNFPYHTFNHLIDFLREAAIDPKVKRIFITLYRTAERSKIINTLINAKKNGKEVIVLEELMARFDEEQNMENSDKMQKAGIIVIHGFKGLKVHSKLILIERKEKGINKGYTYIGTGNFNETTARIYGDVGLLTADQDIASDARGIFDFLLNNHKHFAPKKLLMAPYYMRDQYEALIEREIKNKQKDKKAYIYAKVNSLTDPKIIKLLYKASAEGVEVRLIVRGTCCLQPQVKGLSDNIKAISIVDKYLEHARLFIFGNDGDEQIFIGSADWMSRNLDNRVEVAVPLSDPDIKKNAKDIFNIQWSDNVKARDLTIMGENNYVKTDSELAIRSQIALYDYYKKMI